MPDHIEKVPERLRKAELFHHIDMGFLNRRLCLSFLGNDGREHFMKNRNNGSDHLAQLGNDHLLVTMVIDLCAAIEAPTLLEALPNANPMHMFRSTELLDACQEVYSEARVTQKVRTHVETDKPVLVKYHTEHLVSSTGTMALAYGADEGHQESIIGRIHNRESFYEIEPLVMGNPWFDHPRNGDDCAQLMWMGHEIGEILPEDIDQFNKLTSVNTTEASEWMDVMKELPEAFIKESIAQLLNEPTKKDWGGEENDHFSASVSLGGRRTTAAFLLKGPSKFSEMTLDMCGKRADQILRLATSGAEISIVQHCHLIGEAVRKTIRQFTVYPGGESKKYCLLDGQATYRLLKAYGFV